MVRRWSSEIGHPSDLSPSFVIRGSATSPEAITGCCQRRKPSLSFPRFQEKPFLIARSNTLTAMARIAKPSVKQVRHFGPLPGQVDNEQASAVQDLFRY